VRRRGRARIGELLGDVSLPGETAVAENVTALLAQRCLSRGEMCFVISVRHFADDAEGSCVP